MMVCFDFLHEWNFQDVKSWLYSSMAVKTLHNDFEVIPKKKKAFQGIKVLINTKSFLVFNDSSP